MFNYILKYMKCIRAFPEINVWGGRVIRSKTVFEKQSIFNQNVFHTFGYQLNLMHGGYSNNLYFV
jgi:hypothetical protein